MNLNKPKRLTGLSQKARSRVGALIGRPTRTTELPVYRADLNHPGNIAEHGNAATSARPFGRADLTARRVRGSGFGKTEEAKTSGNALDRPTSVWSEMARTRWNRSHREEQMTTDACRLLPLGAAVQGSPATVTALEYCQARLHSRATRTGFGLMRIRAV